MELCVSLMSLPSMASTESSLCVQNVLQFTRVERRFYIEQTSVHPARVDATPKLIHGSQQTLFHTRLKILIQKRKSIIQILNPENLLMTLNGQ